MQYRWAPWRKEFILGPKPTGCVFCELPRENEDRKSLILCRGEHNFIILNKYPYNNGHLMVVPYLHTCKLQELSNAAYAEMMTLASRGVQALETSMRPTGHNLGMNLGESAGAGIRDHLHLHVVPRWVGDTNFMPLFGDTKVLIEDLWTTYDRLEPLLKG